VTTLEQMFTRWDSPDGHPYKGTLIDWSAYEANPDSIQCYCAQGQVLHLIGDWSPQKLRDADQRSADLAVAKLLNISRGHAVLLRNVNDSIDGAPSIVLTDPGKVIGDQWSKLLDFWWHLDQMTVEQWAAANAAASAAAWAAAWAAANAAASAAAWAAARAAAGAAAWAAAGDAAGDAARDAARDAAWDAAGAAAGAAARTAASAAAWAAAGDAASAAAWDAAGDAARDAARAAAWDAAGDAAWEIQGAAIFIAAKRPFYFLPLFGFNSPDDIPARPSNYGEPAQ
jgi:hypothetical protein